jgi:hypothetical protein
MATMDIQQLIGELIGDSQAYDELKALLLALLEAEGSPILEVHFAASIRTDRLPENLRSRTQFKKIAARVLTNQPDEVAYRLGRVPGFEEVGRNILSYKGHIVAIQRPFESSSTDSNSQPAPAPPATATVKPKKPKPKSGLPS